MRYESNLTTEQYFEGIRLDGRRTNHWLHLALSLCTLGYWLLAWLIIDIYNAQHNRRLNMLWKVSLGELMTLRQPRSWTRLTMYTGVMNR